MDLSSPEVRFAASAVSEAAQTARRIQAEFGAQSLQKGDRSPVTVADYAVQALLAQRLEETFPQDALVAEEDSGEFESADGRGLLEKVVAQLSQVWPGFGPDQVRRAIDRGQGQPNGRFWTLDPIDGTKGFLRGGHYAVALALLEDGRIEAGALGCPHWSGERIWQDQGPGGLALAVRGQGAWWRPLREGSHDIGAKGLRPLQVAAQESPRHARLLRSVEARHTNEDRLGRLARRMGLEADPVRMDSQAKYAALAAGQGDLLLRLLSPSQPDYREKIWDQAAGALILQEAGGRITDLEGRPAGLHAGPHVARQSRRPRLQRAASRSRPESPARGGTEGLSRRTRALVQSLARDYNSLWSAPTNTAKRLRGSGLGRFAGR